MPVIEDYNAVSKTRAKGNGVGIHVADAAKDGWTQRNTMTAMGAPSLGRSEGPRQQVLDRIVTTSGGFYTDKEEEHVILKIRNAGRTLTRNRALESNHRGDVDTYQQQLEWSGRSGRAEVAPLSCSLENWCNK